MAIFVKLNDSNLIENVIAIEDAEITDADGNIVEYIGSAFCQKHIGGKWIMASDSIRGGFIPGIGIQYDESNDVFIKPKEESK